MGTEILINVTARETRIALVTNGALQEVYIERSDKQRIIGNIYKGKVVRVLPGMQAAFVEIGLPRTGFLHQSDLRPESRAINIEDSLKEGQEILVQVIKDPVNTKGARLTAQLSIATRALAYVHGLHDTNVSLKINDPTERQRLIELLEPNSQGFIIRTLAEGVNSLAKDQQYLIKLWNKITDKAKIVPPAELLYKDLSLTLRTFRDLVNTNTDRIIIDDEYTIVEINQFIADFIPEFSGKVELYTDIRPLFDLYSINDEIARALDRKVPLKSGGYLVIDHTEAMTTIDVNTGAYVGNRNLEETVYRTNLEAISAICRQIRLRNLGGIIIVDFIDMYELEHKDKVMRALERELEQDAVKTTVSDFTALGLVEITRKRTRESLQHCLCEQCPTCHGRGFVNTIVTVVCDILREVLRAINLYPAGNVMIISSPQVAEYLMEEDPVAIAEIEQKYGKNIKLQSDILYSVEQFDVVLL